MLTKNVWRKTALITIVLLLFSVLLPLGQTVLAANKPLNLVGACLTTISNNASTDGESIIDSNTVPVNPFIKIKIDKNIVNDTVWTNNQNCFTMETASGTAVPVEVSRIPDTVTFAERNNVFLTPTLNLAGNTAYRIVISPELTGKNGVKLGEAITINFTTVTTDIAVSGITVEPTTLHLTEGGAAGSITAIVSPVDATNQNISWSSSNSSVATVNGGKVTPVAAGEADITATTEDGGFTATCKVTVAGSAVMVEGVKLNKNSASAAIGETVQLAVTVSPTGATNQNVTWTSGTPEVATVSSAGLVTALAEGKTTITVTTEDGGFKDTCQVTVAANQVKVTGITLDKSVLELANNGSPATLTATITPANASNQSVTWKSSDEAVAKVDQTGQVTPVAAGNITITATTVDGGFTASCQVTVTAESTEPGGLPDFTDIINHWACKDIKWLAAQHFIAGINDKLFGPELKVTRAQFTVMLARALGMEPSTKPCFKDVTGNEWYAGLVNAACEKGLAKGSNGKFSPGQIVTREQAAVLLVKAAEIKGKQASDSQIVKSGFKDENQVSNWAFKDVRSAKALGLISGKPNGCFVPKNNVTRAEAAVMIRGLLRITQ